VAKTFHCSIVTPAESVFEGALTYASLPAWDGQRGVLPGQSPILARLGIGELRLTPADGASRWFLVEGGFAQVDHDRLTVLTERATPAEQLTLASAQAELAEANARVIEPGHTSDAERSRVERDQQRALAKVAIARAHGTGGGAHQA
jgi:F-type H+-transporting ATPase subunit epsilon